LAQKKRKKAILLQHFEKRFDPGPLQDGEGKEKKSGTACVNL